MDLHTIFEEYTNLKNTISFNFVLVLLPVYYIQQFILLSFLKKMCCCVHSKRSSVEVTV